jgi:DnaK suppressor protein
MEFALFFVLVEGSMDGKTIQQIRDALLNRWNQIGKSSALPNLEAADNTPSAEIIDIAQNLEQIGRDTSLQEQERRELLAIEKALAKIASGHFGVCEDCGEDIPAKRLLIVPEARLCAHCQTFEERQNQRMRPAGLLRAS